MLNRIFGYFSHDVGIDLGTANTLVFVLGKGIIIREPSVVARNKKSKEILAIGAHAKKMVGRTPAAIEAIRPLRDGVISDFDATAAMLSHYIKKVHESGTVIPKIPRPRVIIGIPSGVTEVERRAVVDAALYAGARKAYLVEEPLAAAIGAGIRVTDPRGHFVVDIGGGTTEIAIISLGGIVVGRSVRIAGDELDEAIANYFRLKYSLLLGQPTAEKLKMSVGSAYHQNREKFIVVRGRDLETGLPKSKKLSSSEAREAMMPVLQEIVTNIKNALEETPPELISDIMERGIYLAGGGALIDGFDKMITEATTTEVHVVKDPLTSVVRGCGELLSNPGLLKEVNITDGL